MSQMSFDMVKKNQVFLHYRNCVLLFLFRMKSRQEILVILNNIDFFFNLRHFISKLLGRLK